MQRIILLLSLIFGILFVIGSAVLSVAFGFTFGNVSGLMAGGLMISAYFLYPKLSRGIRRFITIGLILFFGFFAVIITLIAIEGRNNTVTFQEDCILVLGCGVKGEEVLPLLQARLDKCIEYQQKNPTAIIVVSGGKGRNETITEAQAMKRYLVSKGIDSTQIIKEDQSTNTYENMQFSKPILDSCMASTPNYTVVCITSNYHAFRSAKLARQHHLNATNYNSGVVWYLAPAAYFREVLSLCKYWLIG